jgi:GNAT superfamily N-acetyltransferase
MAEEGWRPATSEDLPRLAELAQQSIEEMRAQKGGDVWAATAARRPPFAEGFAAELRDPGRAVLVGTLDGAVLGYGAALVEALADDRRLGVVTDLFVEPSAREVGIGEALMDALVAWCREQGCFGVDSIALPGDRATKNFFESFGLTARAIVVHRSLR